MCSSLVLRSSVLTVYALLPKMGVRSDCSRIPFNELFGGKKQRLWTISGGTAVRDKFLAFSPPLIGEDEIQEVVDTLRSDWITTGPKVKRFEQEFSSFLGAPDALAVSSCTAALHLALLVFGIGPGDGV